jgi:hypothetical protein
MSNLSKLNIRKRYLLDSLLKGGTKGFISYIFRRLRKYEKFLLFEYKFNDKFFENEASTLILPGILRNENSDINELANFWFTNYHFCYPNYRTIEEIKNTIKKRLQLGEYCFIAREIKDKKLVYFCWVGFNGTNESSKLVDLRLLKLKQNGGLYL